VSAPEDKASGKLRDGALDAQHAFGDLDVVGQSCDLTEAFSMKIDSSAG
jgi:hypothetical protein